MNLSRYEYSTTPFVPLGLSLRGLGDVQSTAAIESTAAAGASALTATLVAMDTISGPVGAAIAGVIGAGLAVASLFKGCGQTCVQATHIVDNVGAQLTQMFNSYMSAPVHYQSVQTAYLQAWDAFWASVVQACSDPSLGQAGVNCIGDRRQGACHYRTSPGGWQKDSSGNWKYIAPGANGSGDTCWDWFVGTRNPVAQDPTVVPDPTPMSAGGLVSSAGNIVNDITGAFSGEMDSHSLLLLGGLALVGFAIMSKEK